MTRPRCEPPIDQQATPGFHWLQSRAGSFEPALWTGQHAQWHRIGRPDYWRPADMAELGWRYHTAATAPERP